MQRLLRDHPRIVLPRDTRKEQHFFDWFGKTEMTDADVARYHEQFPRRPGEIAGDWTPRYMRDIWTPRLIPRAAPDAKILVIFRDPVERYRSGVLHTLARRGGRAATYLATDAVERGRYALQLKRVYDYFDRSQVLVLQFERGIAEPLEQYHRTLEFIGLPPEHVPTDLTRTRGTPQSGKKEPFWDDFKEALVARARARRRRAARARARDRPRAVAELPPSRTGEQRGRRGGGAAARLDRAVQGARRAGRPTSSASARPTRASTGGTASCSSTRRSRRPAKRPQPRVLRRLLQAGDDRGGHPRLPRPIRQAGRQGRRGVVAGLHVRHLDADAAAAGGAGREAARDARRPGRALPADDRQLLAAAERQGAHPQPRRRDRLPLEQRAARALRQPARQPLRLLSRATGSWCSSTSAA